MTPTPDTLPADFFAKKQSAPADTLPPDFFDDKKEAAPAEPKHWWEPGAGRHPGQEKNEQIPAGTEVQGAPIISAGAAIPTAVGYGVSKLGEHVGMPDWANAVAGLVAGGLTSAGTSLYSKISSLPPEVRGQALAKAVQILPKGKSLTDLWEMLHSEPEPTPPEPVRPNPAIAAKMRYGGPAPSEADATSYGGVGMSGAPDAPELPGPATPFKRNPNIMRKLGKGRSAENYDTPAYGPTVRQTGTPALDQPAIKTPSASATPAPPRYAGPNKVNPNIAKKMRFTPGGEDQYSGSAGDQPGATLGTRAEMMRQQRLKAQFLNKQGPPKDDPLDIGDFLQ